jgi:hypothetical protein
VEAQSSEGRTKTLAIGALGDYRGEEAGWQGQGPAGNLRWRSELSMSSSNRVRWGGIGLGGVAIVLLTFAANPARAEDADWTNFTVVVKENSDEAPIANARLTLTFQVPGGVGRFGRSKKISYSAKTNAQGKYKFTNIPKGTIRLMVTAEHHQSFGKEFELEKENQVIEVKLKKPQPLL